MGLYYSTLIFIGNNSKYSFIYRAFSRKYNTPAWEPTLGVDTFSESVFFKLLNNETKI